MGQGAGQGAGQAIEDSVILAGHIKRSKASNVLEVLERYNHDRVQRTGKITKMSNRVGTIAQLDEIN